MKYDTITLCEHCIGAIRSRGEKVYKLDSLDFYEEYDEFTEEKCEWCEEFYGLSELIKCHF